jgi:hypothetical protein
MEVSGFDDFSAVSAPIPTTVVCGFGYDCDWQVDVEEGDACDAEAISGLFALSWI